MRTENAISDLVLVDSVPDGFTVAGFAADVRAAVAPAAAAAPVASEPDEPDEPDGTVRS